MNVRRVKISVSLSSSLVARIDRAARAERRSRSGVLESWLQQGAREVVAREVEEATIAYYEALTPRELATEARLSGALARAGRRLDVDGSARRPGRRRQ